MIVDEDLEVFFVSKYNDYEGEYIRLSNNISYISCLNYLKNESNKSDYNIYIDLCRHNYLKGGKSD